MTKQQLIRNLKRVMDDHGWALDLDEVQAPVLAQFEKDLDELMESNKNCTPPADHVNSDLAGDR